jgi:hypothetical protein
MKCGNMIYFQGKKKMCCDACKGKAFYILEGYEYICNVCDGLGYKLIDVNIDIETLITMIKDKEK